MKMFYAYLIAFLFAVLGATVLGIGIVLCIMLFVAVLQWSITPFLIVNWLAAIKISFIVSIALSIWFMFTKDGTELVDEVYNDFFLIEDE